MKTVETKVEIEALPVGAVLRGASGSVFQIEDHDGTRRYGWNNALSDEPDLPATLIHPVVFDAEDVELVARTLFYREDSLPPELLRWDAHEPNVPDPLAWREYWRDHARAILGTIGEVES